jgi:hypothetical protein
MSEATAFSYLFLVFDAKRGEEVLSTLAILCLQLVLLSIVI